MQLFVEHSVLSLVDFDSLDLDYLIVEIQIRMRIDYQQLTSMLPLVMVHCLNPVKVKDDIVNSIGVIH